MPFLIQQFADFNAEFEIGNNSEAEYDSKFNIIADP